MDKYRAERQLESLLEIFVWIFIRDSLKIPDFKDGRHAIENPS